MDSLQVELPEEWEKDGELAISRTRDTDRSESIRVAEVRADTDGLTYGNPFYVIRESYLNTEILGKASGEATAKLLMLQEARN